MSFVLETTPKEQEAREMAARLLSVPQSQFCTRHLDALLKCAEDIDDLCREVARSTKWRDSVPADEHTAVNVRCLELNAIWCALRCEYFAGRRLLAAQDARLAVAGGIA